ncbi:MAG: type IV toxin-antitoxin system AbiEi family antitoxin domain-containing protein [Solirubrobacterales bacterium]
MGHKSDTVDSRIAKIAARQHGVVTLGQLEDAGLTREATYKRARRGRLHRVHRGVYALGAFPMSHRQRWMAAVLACGEGAVLSHGSAAALWGLLRPIDGPIHVSVPTTSGRKSQRAICLHRCPSLADPPSSPSSPAIRGERGRGIAAHRHNIPVTTVQRTIDDLDGTVPSYLLRRARRQAELMGIRLRGAVGKRSRSDLEEDFLALCARPRLPPPETSVKLGRWEVDFLLRLPPRFGRLSGRPRA